MSVDGERAWTREQRLAIEVRGKETLVSAGAGSGKTSVLVERVIRRLLDPDRPVDITRILVVTFTESAAAEMRERIRRALLEAEQGAAGRRAAAQLALLGKANISTLHSFCLQVLRRHYHAIGLDPRFAVLGEEESRLTKLACLDRVFEHVHAEAEEASFWSPLLDHYGGARDDRSLREIVLQLYEYIQSLPQGEAWLDEVLEAYDPDSPKAGEWIASWSEALCRSALRSVDEAEAHLEAARRLAELPGGPASYLAAFERAGARVAKLRRPLQSGAFDDARAALGAVDWPRLSPPKEADSSLQAEARKGWEEAKKAIRKWSDGAFARPLSAYVEELLQLRPAVAALCELVRRFGREYASVKERQSVIDFADLERMALRVLEVDGGRYGKEYRARFDEVLVDEYQDINPVQDRLLELLSRPLDQGPNRFMVGDVKQSIYRFRLADPSIFQEKFRTYGKAQDGATLRIDLQANFRSEPHILRAVNFLFRQLMHSGTGRIEYGPDAFLHSGRRRQEGAGEGAREAAARAVELHLIERPRDDEEALPLAPIEREAALVAHLIRSLTEPGGSAYRFRDIAVLMRSPRGRAGAFVSALAARGIPAYTQAGAGFFQAVEVDVIVSLLRLLENARQDIPLAAVLRSPLVGLSSEELAQVRAGRAGSFADAAWEAAAEPTPLGRRLAAFWQRLDEWRTLARRQPLSRVVRRIYAETKYVDFVAALPQGGQRAANLWGLYRYAREFDAFRTEGLDRFLRFVDALAEANQEIASPPALGENDDVVHVMSVHQSKGLEFPVVFLVDLDRGFNRTDLRRAVIFHRRLGVGVAVLDRERRVRYPSLPHRAVAEELNQDALEEEMRLLYVATTRAKERMIWVGSVRDAAARAASWAQSARVKGWELPAGDVLGASSWLDWIGRTVVRHRDGTLLRALAAGDLGADFYRPADPEVFDDPASFCVTLWSAADVDGLAGAAQPVCAASIPLELMGRRRPLEVGLSPQEREAFARRYEWQYPLGHGALPAKVSVTEYARLRAEAEGWEPDERGGAGEAAVTLRPLPSFGEGRGPRPPTPAERGTATHRVLAHADFTKGTDPDAIRAAVRELVARELLAPEQAAAVPVHAISRFFETELGRTVLQALREARQGKAVGMRLWREMPFTMLVAADRLAALPHPEGFLEADLASAAYGPAAPAGGHGHIVMQGTIDCVVYDGQRARVIDYKTDRVRPGEEKRLLPAYARQLELYREFVARVLPGVPILAYLVFLHTGRIVPVNE